MTRRITLLTGLALVLAGVACSGDDDTAGVPDTVADFTTTTPPAEVDEAAALDAFEAYGEALLERKGQQALETLTASSELLYDEYRIAALTATRAEIEARPVVDQLNILGLRALLDLDQLQSFDGGDAFIFAVNAGLVREQNVANVTVDRIEIEGDRAEVYFGGQEALTYTLLREFGRWRLDLTDVVDAAEPAFQLLLDRLSPNRDEALLAYLREFAPDIGPEVFEPPLAR